MNPLKILAIFLVLLFAGCATTPPQKPRDICSIFQEKKEWYLATLEAEKAWDIPIPVQMAIINQESSYIEDARPARRWFLGFIPLSRPSTAYGYSQALDGTWDRYVASTGNSGAARDNFEDAVDFIGWYSHQTHSELGIPKTDAYRQYLAYHEGQNGYRKGSYRSKAGLIEAARKVSATASNYQKQLRLCEQQLQEDSD